jgi:hypothetical protein
MKRPTVMTEQQYQRGIFKRFAEALSEDGKTKVITNWEHQFLGFVISLADIPLLATSEQKEVLGRIFLTHYASEAWRVRNDLPMAGNLAPTGYSHRCPIRHSGASIGEGFWTDLLNRLLHRCHWPVLPSIHYCIFSPSSANCPSRHSKCSIWMDGGWLDHMLGMGVCPRQRLIGVVFIS